MHDPQFVEAARFLAGRIITEGGESSEERLRFGFRVVTSRPPGASELAVLRRSLDRWREKYSADRDAAEKLLSVGALPRDEDLEIVEHAAYTAVARVLMNLSEAITKE